jgi:hypothetical protein
MVAEQFIFSLRENMMKAQQRRDWMAKTQRLNESLEISVGDEIVDVEGHKGIVVKVIPGVSIEDHGTVYVWQSERVEYGADNCEHYIHYNWKPFLRILTKRTSI